MQWVDAHTHVYPNACSVDPQSWAKARGEAHWASLVAPRINRPSLQGFVDQSTMLKAMDKGGIEKALILGWYWQNPQTCHEHNTFMAQWIQQEPDRFAGVMALHPRMENVLDALRDAKDQGFVGIGELFPLVQGYSMQDALLTQILDWASEQGFPITFHVTEPIGRDYPGALRSPLQDYLYLAQRYPNLKLVLAHWGGLLPFYELNPFVQKAFKNVYYDTAASPLLYDPRIWRAVLNIVGAKKLLFGSDYPLRLDPKDPKPRMAPFIEEAQKELSFEERVSILGANARALWGLR